jgi:hypothetical protein
MTFRVGDSERVEGLGAERSVSRMPAFFRVVASGICAGLASVLWTKSWCDHDVFETAPILDEFGHEGVAARFGRLALPPAKQ